MAHGTLSHELVVFPELLPVSSALQQSEGLCRLSAQLLSFRGACKGHPVLERHL